MKKPTKLVVDCSTGTKSEIELTDSEIAQMQANEEAYIEQKALEVAKKEQELANKESAKSKLLELGLSEEEISALVK
jgi:hypothetical protein